jgi:hypothetical protein
MLFIFLSSTGSAGSTVLLMQAGHVFWDAETASQLKNGMFSVMIEILDGRSLCIDGRLKLC